jgi:hypothetical protein
MGSNSAMIRELGRMWKEAVRGLFVLLRLHLAEGTV